MDKTIDFQQRSKKYRTRYMEMFGKIHDTGNNASNTAEVCPGSTISDKEYHRDGSIQKLTKVKFGARKPRNDTPKEEDEQIRFSAWLTKQGIKHTASANGGKRSLATGRKLKAMGVSKGFPDIEIPIPAGGYGGLYIELKRQKGSRIEPEQQEWLDYLNSIGKCAKVAYGFEQAKQIVLEYMALTRPAA